MYCMPLVPLQCQPAEWKNIQYPFSRRFIQNEVLRIVRLRIIRKKVWCCTELRVIKVFEARRIRDTIIYVTSENTYNHVHSSN